MSCGTPSPSPSALKGPSFPVLAGEMKWDACAAVNTHTFLMHETKAPVQEKICLLVFAALAGMNFERVPRTCSRNSRLLARP